MTKESPEEHALSVEIHSSTRSERNDCTVRALAISTGIPYAEAHYWMEVAFNRRFRGRCVFSGERLVILYRTLGYTLEVINLRPIVAHKGSELTVRTVCDWLPWRRARYLVWTKGHVLAVVDGTVYDWTAGRRHRIIAVMRLRKLEELENGIPRRI